ncbi:hypothetical protein [Lysinibacillus pakistanensis]|uniref:hypothetical protein n=1 Tax=Lysinibacillus pakistanensis TaxID=759811 RepID=UPI003D2911D2
MLKKNKGIIFSICTILLIFGVGSQLVFSKGKNVASNDVVDLEYAVAKVLSEMPEITINQAKTSRVVDIESVEASMDSKKAEFRLKVQNEVSNLKNDNAYLERTAVADTNKYLEAIQIAKEIYGVSVTQEEVNHYIDKNVTGFVNSEKEEYAKALGLSLYELDYSFDRDFYVMDTLWDKLIPVLMERYPQEDGEDNNLYLERIKKEFYSNSL